MISSPDNGVTWMHDGSANVLASGTLHVCLVRNLAKSRDIKI